MASITRAAVALPRLRLDAKEAATAWGRAPSRGVDTLTVAAYDEDAVTLAWEAIGGLGDVDDVPYLAFATRDGTTRGGTLAEALGLHHAHVATFGGSDHAGVSALLAAVDHVSAHGGRAIAVAADVRRAVPGSNGDAAQGAGAVAFLVEAEGGARVMARASRAREGMEAEPPLDPAGDLAGDLLASFAPVDGADHVVAHPAPRRTRGPGGKPVDVTTTLLQRTGDLGAAALAELVLTLGSAAAGQRVAAVQAGPGEATAVALDVQGLVPVSVHEATPKPVPYVRALQEARSLEAPVPHEPMGAFVSLPEYLSDIDARYRLVARRCGEGHLHFPPRNTCPVCASGDLTPERLSGRGKVHAYTIIGAGGAPGEFAAEQYAVGAYPVAVVELEEGPRITARLTDVEPEALAVDLPVRPALRRLYEQQGVVRYGLKFTPV